MDYPRPANDTGIGVHSDPNAYFKPADPYGYADDLYAHKVRWFLHWYYDEGATDFIRIMRQKGIEVIGRPGPAKMPRPNIDMAVIDAYIAAGVRWFIIMNELNLHEEWEEDWHNFDKPIRKCADRFVQYADAIRDKGAWVLTPPPSLGGHVNHREWFNRFMYAMCNIASERGQTLRQLLWHCGIGLHCRSVGNPLEADQSWYDCSAKEWQWFRDRLLQALGETLEEFEANPIPMMNTEAFDEPQWLPEIGGKYDWGLWGSRNETQMRWFNPNNPGYRYPDYLLCNCFWVIHADRFSPWPQCSLISNYTHYVQRGDYTTDLWRAMPGVITWTRTDEVEPQPEPKPEPEPEPEPGEIEFVGLSEEMIDMLTLSPAPEEDKARWMIWKVEVQPTTNHMSAWAICPKAAGRPTLFWGGGEAAMNWKDPDPLSPPGARQGGYEMPMHHAWGSFGVRMPGNSESLFGIGLYGDNLQITHTAHHPTLVHFRLVEPEPEPEPQPYKFKDALNERLRAAGLPEIIDTRTQIEEAYVDMALMEQSYKRGLGPEDLQAINLHHIGEAGYVLDVMALAYDHIKERHYPNIGPHFCIEKDGQGYFTKKLAYHGPQAGNSQANRYGISIEANGRFDENPDTGKPFEQPTEAQLKTLHCIVQELERFVAGGWGCWQPLPIVPHRCVTATACPGNLYEAYREFLAK
jgi:hypothetical protein